METFLILPTENCILGHIRKHNKLLFLLTLPVYFFIVQQSIQNKHTHFYANGLVVTHSHPVDTDSREPIDHHNHSKTEICFFNTFHFHFFTISEPLTVALYERETEAEFLVTEDIFCNSSHYFKMIPRGPPTYCLC